MKEALQNIRQSADALIAQAADAAAVDELRVRFLGKKGELTAILKQMGRLSAEERPVDRRSWPTRCARPSTADIARAHQRAGKRRAGRSAWPRRNIDVTHAGQQRPRRASATLSSRCWAS